MKPEWKQFLINQGAEFDGDVLSSFGNANRERRLSPEGACLCDLSHLGLISVSGSDARNFLQGQLSNDVEQLSDQSAQLNAYCNPKGRTIATFLMFQRQSEYYLSLSADLLEPVLKRLRMFVMRSEVVLHDAQNKVHFGYSGANAEVELQQALGQCPMAVNQVFTLPDLSIIRRHGEVPRFEIYAELEAGQKLWEQLGVNAAAVGGECWDYMNIRAGIPTLDQSSSEAWVPQMINLHLIDAVSFNKGCFPGQEVVARLKYLGKNKRQMYRVLVNQATEVASGTTISSSDDASAGTLLQSAYNADGLIEGLAVLKKSEVDKALILGETSVSLLGMPYTLDD